MSRRCSTISKAASPGGGPVELAYVAPRPGEPVELTIYSVSGAPVRRLTGVPVSVGRHAVTWDGRDQAGEKVASGVYFVRCRAAGEIYRARLVILR